MPGVTGGNNPHNWSDLDTDSEAEEAQKKNFFDSLNWVSETYIITESPPYSPGDMGNFNLDNFLSQGPRSPKDRRRGVEAPNWCSVDILDGHGMNSEDLGKSFNDKEPNSYTSHQEEQNSPTPACYVPLEAHSGAIRFQNMYLISNVGADHNKHENGHLYSNNQLHQPQQQQQQQQQRNLVKDFCMQEEEDEEEIEEEDEIEEEEKGALQITRHFDSNLREARCRGTGRTSSCSVRHEQDRDSRKLKEVEKMVILTPFASNLDFVTTHAARVADPRLGMEDSEVLHIFEGSHCPEFDTKEMFFERKKKDVIKTHGSSKLAKCGSSKALFSGHNSERINENIPCKRSISLRNPDGTGRGRESYASLPQAHAAGQRGSEQITSVGMKRGLIQEAGFNQRSRASDCNHLHRIQKISRSAENGTDDRAAEPSNQMRVVQTLQPPSPTINLDLRRKVEELERLVADERIKFQAIADRLAEQKIEAERKTRQLQDSWDVKFYRLPDVEDNVHDHGFPEIALQDSSIAGQGSTFQPVHNNLQTVGSVAVQCNLPHSRLHERLKKADAEAEQARRTCNQVKAAQLAYHKAQNLRLEVEEQETLIRGYQYKKEIVVGKLEEIQAKAKENARSLSEENAKLASQLLHLQQQSVCLSSGPLAAKELLLQDVLDHEAKLKEEVAVLEEKLTKAHSEMEIREASIAKAVDDLETEVASLKLRLTEERESHNRTSVSREAKMKSLAENRDLLSSFQSTIEEQAAQNLELSSMLAECKRELENGKVEINRRKEGASSDSRALKCGQPAQKHVQKPGPKDGKKEPVGLSALAQTSKGGSEEGDKVRKLQTEMAALQKQIFHKEDVNNRKLNFMKQELKKAKQEYEKRVQNPKQQQSQVGQSEIEAASMNELAAQARVKELEAQVVNIRIHYVRKIKEVSDKLEESRTEQARVKAAAENLAQVRKPNTNSPIRVRELEAKERVHLLEDIIGHKELTLRSLQDKIQALQASGVDGPCSVHANHSTSAMITAKQVASLSDIKNKIQSNSQPRVQAAQVIDMTPDNGGQSISSQKLCNPSCEPQNEIMIEKSNKMEKLNSVTSPTEGRGIQQPSPDSELDIVSLRKQLEKSEVSREVLQQQCKDAMEKAALFSLQHQQTLQHLHHISNHSADQLISANLVGSTNGRGNHEALDGGSYNGALQRPSNYASQARVKGLSKELQRAEDQTQKQPTVNIMSPSRSTQPATTTRPQSIGGRRDGG